MSLYNMTEEGLLVRLNKRRKKPLVKEDVFLSEIELSTLKSIDKVFGKGIYYYLDPNDPEKSSGASVFFRKTKFGSDLSFADRKLVNKFEEFKILLSSISKLAELRLERKLHVVTINDNPKMVAAALKRELQPKFIKDPKNFLNSLISKFSDKNIFVFEFVENWNKKDKADIDGFYLSPNMIVIKRQQLSLTREIFTLIHELGHYLLNEEEIEQIDDANMSGSGLSEIERWCNDFAFYFLAGDFGNTIDNLDFATYENDYHLETIANISQNTHLSQLSIFTRLLLNGKIAPQKYNRIKADFEKRYKERQEKINEQRQIEKESGNKPHFGKASPINAPLTISTLQAALYEGLISEQYFCRILNIKPSKLGKYLL